VIATGGRSVDRRNLDIGEVIVSDRITEIVWTVLGSCISVIFHVPKVVSVLCHAQLPFNGNFECNCSDNCPKPCQRKHSDSTENKYVSCSIKNMVNILHKNNVTANEIRTTLVGGASVLGKIVERQTIGEKNVEVAREMLDSLGIKINRELTGGKTGYTIWYRTDNDKLIIRRHGEKNKIELLYS
jgi:chemotaxis receptor (MCP) glutamine deamidase CheD